MGAIVACSPNAVARELAREPTGANDGANEKAALHGDDNNPASPVSECGRSPNPVGGFLAQLIAEADLAGLTSSRPTWADYLACYDGDRFAESMRYVRRYPEELPVLAELLPQIATPVTIINGRYDRVVPLANAEFLDERLPNSRVAIIDAGHFVWEEAPTEYASIIVDSLTGRA
jgi:pimeloyl-ACP methyl ester carboxylesterase